ncbi:MAG: hypothetical protein CMJ77_20480 [Planctomycetaceae bacterium]|nr:hypothetical protein [Planctomycetaceae bacterium]
MNEWNEQLKNEYESLTQKCGFVDLGHRTQIELTGDDHLAFLHNLCTNEIKGLEVGRGCEAYLTSVRGKVVAHILVFRTAEGLIVETAAEWGQTLMEHFDRYIIMEDVQLQDHSSDWRELLVSGVEACEGLARLGVAEIPQEIGDHLPATIDERQIWLRRVPFLDQPTFVIAILQDQADAIEQALRNADFFSCSQETFHRARVETGFPWFPQDIGEDNLAQEVARDQQAISFTKGCYLGQEIVARIDALGRVNHTLTMIRMEGNRIPAVGTEIHAGSNVVGKISSVTYSPRQDSILGLAILRCSALKSSLQVDGIPAVALTASE